MSLRAAVLKEGHRHNTVKSVDASISDLNWHPSLGPGIQNPIPLKKGLSGIISTPISMDDAVAGSGKTHAIDLNSYLSSPIRTLYESINDPEHLYISNHDIVEAYNVLCLRIRSRKDDISRPKEPGFLSIFEEKSALIEQCISRDIRRVLYTPLDSQRHRGNASFNLSYESDLSEEVLPDIVENMLCQYAIRLMSDLFMFPALYSKFSHGQLSSLFQDAVSLCTLRASHIYDIERLCCMVLLMLHTQQLPLPILQSGVAVLVDALGYAITNEQGIAVGKVDAFRAIHSILRKYPVLLPSFTPLLAPILGQLNAVVSDVRLEAVVGLSAFAILKLSPVSFPHHEVAEAVDAYVKEEHSKQQADQFRSLPTIVKSALADDTREFWQRKGPGFAVSLASTLLILLDYRIFISPPALKLVFSVITETASRRWTHVNAHTEIWKMLIWAFARLPRKEKDLTDTMARMQGPNCWKDTRERAFRVVKQELKNGLGVALVGALLWCTPDGVREASDVEKAVEILEEMLVREDEGVKRDVVLLLERLLSGIGAQSQEKTEWKDVTVGFASDLVDGSLIGKTLRELTLQPAKIPLEGIRPLSEAEASAHWDRLSAIWVLIVQDLLVKTNDDLPLNIVEIWQALLLMRGQLTESHQHLTAPYAFASRVATIMTGFSVPLVTPGAQVSYLSTIAKLWTVVKNVFNKLWLSSPAERILASLLKKHFDLSDENVKNHWGRICAELVSVGVPTLLHVLHTRTLSSSQEGKEVTRHLWSVLAENDERLACDIEGGDSVPEGDWMELVHLLAMPFGAWDMDDSEIQTWGATFSRAIVAGSKVSKPSYEVISVILDILGDSKLPLLKDQPKVLWSLLSRLVSAPCTAATRRLLTVTDDFLGSLYSHDVDSDAYGLEFLHLIGRLFAQSSVLDSSEFILAMPNGLCKWIADEDSILTQDEHRDVIISVYATALEKLSFLEPSVDHLHIFADLLQSGFVRIQADALLSFQKFWRATYHQRKDISRKSYPVAIKACLKAWGDVCDDSLADDISLGSESQSLESYTVPDSQPSPVKHGKGHEDADITALREANFDSGVAFSGNDDEITSTMITPKARKAVLASSPTTFLPAATKTVPAIQDHQENSHSPSSGHLVINSLAGPSSNPPLKRRSYSEAPQTHKKRRIESDFLGRLSRSKKKIISSSGKMSQQQASVSEPVTRTPSLSLLPPFSISQPLEIQSHMRPQDETPSWLGSDLKRVRDHIEADGEFVDKGEIPSDDYDSWERGMLTGLREDEEPVGQTEWTDPASEDILSPSLGQFPIHSRRRDRSQTAPEPSILPWSESVSIPQASKYLRRHQSSPLEQLETVSRKASSAQLDALQRAYAIITDTGTSQVDVQDIMHARRLANQINQVLDEQMCLKFGACRDGSP